MLLIGANVPDLLGHQGFNRFVALINPYSRARVSVREFLFNPAHLTENVQGFANSYKADNEVSQTLRKLTESRQALRSFPFADCGRRPHKGRVPRVHRSDGLECGQFNLPRHGLGLALFDGRENHI